MENTILGDRLYTSEHEWVLLENKTAIIGITHHAQTSLGDITFVELPAVGDELQKSGEAGVVESVKAASDIYSPLSGTVTEVNSDLEEHPEIINHDCYGEGWIFKLSIADEAEINELLSPEDYAKIVEEDR